ESTEIGRNARHALKLARDSDGAFPVVPQLEHQIVDHVYSYGIAAAETVPVALALATAARDRIAEPVPPPPCLPTVADSPPPPPRPARARSPGHSAAGRRCRLPGGTHAAPSPAARRPGSPGPTSYTSPNCWRRRN